jgi:3-oxocholest-4-en-26-oate---CoA ligase
MARPLLDHLTAHPDLSLPRLRFLVSGGAPLSPGVKAALVERLPGLSIVDIMGSSESGRVGIATTKDAKTAATGTFDPSAGGTVLDEALSREVAAGEDELGWLARSGAVPLGYLGDEERTKRTFPVIDGVRYAVPGDRARRLADGTIEVLGRDAATINTGGEKVFAEEVELALLAHPAVADVLVVGRPSERWGQEVVAVVALRPGHPDVSDESLLAACTTTLSKYKCPKAFMRVDEVRRTPSGKPDYAWAKVTAAG